MTQSDGTTDIIHTRLSRAVVFLAGLVIVTGALVGALWLRRAPVRPDGPQIAFVSNADGDNLDLYLADLDRRHAHALTNTADHELAPAWAPDGKSIAFVRVATDHLGWGGGPWTSSEGLYAMSFEEEEPVETMLLPAEEAGLGPIAWSPDGRLLAMLGFQHSTTAGGPPSALLTILDVARGDHTAIPLPVTGGVITPAPTWSPDSNSIVFSAYVLKEGEIGAVAAYRYDLADATLTLIADRGEFACHSPASDAIAYADAVANAYRTDSRAGEPTLLLPAESDYWSALGLSWAPQGDRLAAIVPAALETVALRVVTSSGQVQINHTLETNLSATGPAWSADGRYLACTVLTGTDASNDWPTGSMLILDTQTEQAIRWPSGTGHLEAFAAWRPAPAQDGTEGE